jgi:hypothetical protein
MARPPLPTARIACSDGGGGGGALIAEVSAMIAAYMLM